MWKPAEAVNDRFVLELRRERFFKARCAEQAHRFPVDLARLAVHKGHVEECPLLNR